MDWKLNKRKVTIELGTNTYININSETIILKLNNFRILSIVKTNLSALMVSVFMALVLSNCKDDSPSPSHFLLAFTSAADHNYGEIFLCNSDGSDSKRISELTTKSLSDAEYFPEFSPDGNFIKFRGFDYMLKVYHRPSGQLSVIDKSWSSAFTDDNHLVYIPTGLSNQIYISPPDGVTKRLLTQFDPTLGMNDTLVGFQGIAWYGSEKKIISSGVYNDVRYLFKVDPQTGAISDMYPLNLAGEFLISESRVSWTNADTIFVHDLLNRQTKYFIAEGESPKNPVASPNGLRIAYTTDRTYNYQNKTYTCTDVVTCNLSGFSKRKLTQNDQLEDSWKYKATFKPCWKGNDAILYSAGNVFEITDAEPPLVKTLVGGVKAGGQLHVYMP